MLCSVAVVGENLIRIRIRIGIFRHLLEFRINDNSSKEQGDSNSNEAAQFNQIRLSAHSPTATATATPWTRRPAVRRMPSSVLVEPMVTVMVVIIARRAFGLNFKHGGSPVGEDVRVPDLVVAPFALGADRFAARAPLGRVGVVEAVVGVQDVVVHGADEGLAGAGVVEVFGQFVPEEGHFVRSGGADAREGEERLGWWGMRGGGGNGNGRGEAHGSGGGEVVDDGAQAAVEFDFGVEHVLDDLGQEPAAHDAPQAARIEETATFTEFVKGVGHAGEVKGDVRRDVFDIERDDLLLEDEEVSDEEELAVDGGRFRSNQGGGLVEGNCRFVDNFVS